MNKNQIRELTKRLIIKNEELKPVPYELLIKKTMSKKKGLTEILLEMIEILYVEGKFHPDQVNAIMEIVRRLLDFLGVATLEECEDAISPENQDKFIKEIIKKKNNPN